MTRLVGQCRDDPSRRGILNRWTVGLWLVFFLLLYPASPAGLRVACDSSEAARSTLREISTLVKASDWPGLQVAGRELIRLCPSAAQGHYWLGTALFNQNRYFTSARSFRRAVELGYDQAHLALAQAYSELKQGHFFQEELEAAKRAAPEKPAVYFVEGKYFYEKQNRLDLAELFLPGCSSWLSLALALTTSLFAESAQFTDIAAKAGLRDVFYCGRDDQKDYIIEALGGGVALLDYDRDGHLDVFLVTGSRLEGFPPDNHPSNHLYQNNRDGGFTRVTEEAGLTSAGWGQGVCVGDFDNDGFDDLFVTFFGQNRLYRNSGKSSFVDVTEHAGIQKQQRWSTGCAFLDYDRDGLLDLFVANYIVFVKDRIPPRGSAPTCRWKSHPVFCGPRGLPGETNELYKNLGSGKFKDVSAESGVEAVKNRYSLSVTTVDYNHDGWVDIYVAVDSQASILFRNNGDGTFQDVGVFAAVALSENGNVQAGMGSAAGDVDGDGNLDLIKTNFIDETSNIYLNNGDESFEDQVFAYGIGTNTDYMGWGVGFLDYNRDTWPDLFIVNGHLYPELEPLVPNNPYKQRRLLYKNVAGKRLENVSHLAGRGVTTPHSSRGLALGDYDNDGDVDIFINNMNEPPSLLRNDSDARGGFLSIQLVGTKSNLNAIGARVSVVVGERELVQEVRSGSSFMSHSDFRLHFGVGDAKVIDKIEIEWPRPDSKETIRDVQVNQFITVTEQTGIAAKNSFRARTD